MPDGTRHVIRRGALSDDRANPSLCDKSNAMFYSEREMKHPAYAGRDSPRHPTWRPIG